MWIGQVWPLSYLVNKVSIGADADSTECWDSFRVLTSPSWFHPFWSQTQHVPLCWGRNAAPTHLCKHTNLIYLYLFPIEYQMFQCRSCPDSVSVCELVWLTWRSWLFRPSCCCCCRFVGCRRGRSAGWTGSSSSPRPEPPLPQSRCSFSLNHKKEEKRR